MGHSISRRFFISILSFRALTSHTHTHTGPGLDPGRHTYIPLESSEYFIYLFCRQSFVGNVAPSKEPNLQFHFGASSAFVLHLSSNMKIVFIDWHGKRTHIHWQRAGSRRWRRRLNLFIVCCRWVCDSLVQLVERLHCFVERFEQVISASIR